MAWSAEAHWVISFDDSTVTVDAMPDGWEHRRVTDYVYDMSDSERDALTEQFLATKRPDSGRFACFTLEGTDPFANIARQVERAVFEDSWGNDATLMKKEWGPYDEHSLFFMVVDTQEKVPAGVLRMIRNSPLGLKTLVDLDDSIKSPIAPATIPTVRHHAVSRNR